MGFCCLICIVFHVAFQLSSPNTAVRTFDCILVAHTVEAQDDQRYQKQKVYINELKSKNLKVTVSPQLQSNRSQEMFYHNIMKHLLCIHRKSNMITRYSMAFVLLRNSSTSISTC